jgi:hypothetical protein
MRKETKSFGRNLINYKSLPKNSIQRKRERKDEGETI